MYFSDYLRYAIKGILSKKLRFLLTILSICIGMTSVILITTIGKSGNEAVSAELDKLGLNGVSFKSKLLNFSLKDKDLIQDYLGNQYYVSSLNKEIASIKNDYSEEYSALVWGGEEQLLDVLNIELLYGRGIRKKDLDSVDNVALISKSSAVKLFGKENAIGEELNIVTTLKSQKFVIVGVVDNSNLYDMFTDEIPQFVYIPSSTMMEVFRLKSLDEISVVSKENADLDSMSQNVIQFLEKEKDRKKIYYYENLNVYKKSISKIADIVTLIIALIGSIALIVGGISVMNTMMVSVSERTKEIGIKKAIGFTNRSILIEFLIEALIITLMACVIGIIVGLLLSYLLLNYYHFDFKLDLGAIRNSLLFSVAMGIIFGVYPAFKASKLNPIDALK